MKSPLVSVVMPCLNEERGIGICIRKIQKTLQENKIDGEIIVCDNGSTDLSATIASEMGAKVVYEDEKGYGRAYIKGFKAALGKYLIMGDADDTYDFTLIPIFLKKLQGENYDFVTGTRNYKRFAKKNSPILHQLVGNPAITALLNMLFGTKYTDVYCGFRGFSRSAYDIIHPVSPGMEFNLELAINAGLAKLKIAEIPIILHPRIGESKLRTFRDGWRSLRMMLVYCPNKVFIAPGFLFLSMGILLHIFSIFFYQSDRQIDYLILGFLACVGSIIGFQIISLGLHTKSYSWSRRFEQDNQLLRRFYQYFKLESGLILGVVLVLFGLGIALFHLLKSESVLNSNYSLISFLAVSFSLVIIGSGTIFSSLFISAMSMTRNKEG